MEKRLLLNKLEEKVEDYRQSRSATAELDISIFRQFCQGKRVTQIALEIPCVESTVYRSLRRGREFLRVSDMDVFWNLLRRNLGEDKTNLCCLKAESVLEILYNAFAESYNEIANYESGYKRIEVLQNCLLPQSKEEIVQNVCDLCQNHEKTGFLEGLKLGLGLAMN